MKSRNNCGSSKSLREIENLNIWQLGSMDRRQTQFVFQRSKAHLCMTDWEKVLQDVTM